MSFQDIRAQILAVFAIISIIVLSVNVFIFSQRMINNPDQATDIFRKGFPELILDLVNPLGEIFTLVLASVLAAGIFIYIWFRNN